MFPPLQLNSAPTPEIFSGVVAAFTPATITGLKLWLDASDNSTTFQDSTLVTPATANNDPVGGWKDKSGNNYHVLQSTSSKRPSFKTALYNAKSSLRFDGVDDYLVSGNPALAVGSYSFFFVYYGASGGNLKPVFSIGDFGSINYMHRDGGGSGWTGATYLSGGGPGSLYTSQNSTYRQESFILEIGIGTVKGYRNGTVAPNSYNYIGDRPIGTQMFEVGGLVNESWRLNGDVSEIIMYSGALTTVQRQQVEAYLKEKWATP